MYLHLGQDTIVKQREIIGIFDIDNTTVGKDSKKFLNQAEKNHQVVSITYEIPKTFVVVSKKTRKNKHTGKKKEIQLPPDVVYLSQISSHTLKKRTGYLYK